MGFKKWLRKKMIGEIEQQMSPVQQQMVPPICFEVDQFRHDIIMSILHGRPFFVIYHAPTGMKTLTTGLTPMQIQTALDDIATKIPEMKEILTNVAIDINSRPK